MFCNSIGPKGQFHLYFIKNGVKINIKYLLPHFKVTHQINQLQSCVSVIVQSRLELQQRIYYCSKFFKPLDRPKALKMCPHLAIDATNVGVKTIQKYPMAKSEWAPLRS
ncbi:hypothetical protein ABPG72_019814 [Tetrahymena utriculariae]